MNYGIDLSSHYTRPVINIKVGKEDIVTIIDTGAIKSVWNDDVDSLKHFFPDAEPTVYRTRVSGFGGKSNTAREIWKIPVLELQDSTNLNQKYVLHNFLVAIVDDMNLGFDFIIGATAFNETNYSICNKGGDKGSFIINFSDRLYSCTVRGGKKMGGFIYVESFISFLQDDF